MKKKKKLYLVSREVLANSIKHAISQKGIIYAISLAEDKSQPQETKVIGLNIKK